MNPISHVFMDWVVERLRSAIPAEWADKVHLHDDRETDLAELIFQNLNEGTGCCVAVSFPHVRKEGDPAPSNTQYRVQVEVGVVHNAVLLPELSSHALAETLFRAFVGAEYECGGFLAYDVGADNLNSTVNGAKQTHLFSVSYTITI